MADVDLQAKLRELLADPTALSGIMSLVSSLNLSQPASQLSQLSQQTQQPNFSQPASQPSQSFPQSAPPPNQQSSTQSIFSQPTIPSNDTDSAAGISTVVNADGGSSTGDDSIPVFARQPDMPKLPVRTGGREQSCALLYALKPYLAPKRAEKIDMMIRLMQLTELTRGMLGGRS